MAEQTRTRQKEEQKLAGGNQGGNSSRLIGPDLKEEGTPAIASAGEVHVKAPPATEPQTHLGTHLQEGDTQRLAGGLTPELIRRHLNGIQFPTKKDDLIHRARQNGASDEM